MVGKVVDKDLGYKGILRTIFSLRKKSHVSVGIVQSEKKHPGSPYSVAQIAAVHEFGSDDGRIPQRSFIRSTYDENLKDNVTFLKQLQAHVLLGKLSKAQALTTLGEVVSKQMVEKINGRELQPNQSATIKRKKSSTPLVDTGQLKGSLTFEVKA
jgi:phage gpG-like protein